MAYGCRYIRRLAPDAYREFGKNKADRIIKKALVKYNRLCEENAEEAKETQAHTRKHIYPAIAVFLAMLEENVKRESAAEFLNIFYEKQTDRNGYSYHSTNTCSVQVHAPFFCQNDETVLRGDCRIPGEMAPCRQGGNAV